ncbi:uracil-DNA glycosylase family protein [Pseudovibrio sp. SPO723]|uniref:uracil-DNA glycosylase family protein n=1 Tax=Nesiotobacter zosterae TaxID=392721 RepID=UPI0029C1A300|nr:uracil-DNA glycosylase family protein [Pseudovibrio sp. SPO723]MDX5593618.1 uracil-DNA glycosylase family protein [Pseudovibrio sp. SPO723]
MSAFDTLRQLEDAISSCRVCVEAPLWAPLPHEPRPVAVLSSTARLCICGQAPGTRVHASGRPFTDPSGVRLREWMGIEEAQFYNPNLLSIVPMGFCFPGLDSKGGDKPPRKECRRTWHDHVFRQMPQLETVFAVGAHAHQYHLGELASKRSRETIASFKEIWEVTSKRRENGEGPAVLPLPHPSWRNNAWLKKNAWFEEQVLPLVKKEVARLMA